jgi:hypothetical protein
MRRATILLVAWLVAHQTYAQTPGPAELAPALEYGVLPHPALVPGAGTVSTRAAKVPGAAPEPTAEIIPQAPQLFDYSANLKSDVFGAQLFTGSFARQGATWTLRVTCSCHRWDRSRFWVCATGMCRR